MNKKLFTKLFALVLAVCVVFSLAIIVSSAAEETATITFDDASKRTTSTTTQQIWEENGITVTYNKGSYNNDLAEYANPVRFYANTQVIIEAPGNITKIEVVAGSSTYATAFQNSAGSEATASGSNVTIVPTASSTSYTIAKFTAQSRVKSITVTYEAAAVDPDAPVCEHANTEVIEAVEPTCTETGLTEGTKCLDCGEITVKQTEIKATGHTGGTATCEAKAVCDTCGESYGDLADHNYVDGVCDECGAEEPDTGNLAATFVLGADGAASHYDGTSNTTYSETVDGYTLSISGGTKMYTGARDLLGNSCIKFGTGSAAGSMTITVPDDISSIVIYVAGYKANAATVTINGTATVLTGRSNSGTYDAITVDTTTNKTVSFSVTSNYRAMVNTIEFYASSDAPVCEHANTTDTVVEPSCYVAGSTTAVCNDCGKVVSVTAIPAAHKFVEGVCSVCNVIEAPKTGVAYKFGMYQSNKETIYYVSGGMSGHYMATATDASSGIYVFLEETNGGYYMYTYVNGVKTYMNMVVSGSYVNAKYENTASTVYTYDADNLALVASVNSSKYYFGTYNNYTTVGTTYNSTDHICRFYATEQPAAPKFDTASVKLGTDLAMIYTVTVPAGAPTMTIEFNGKTVTIEKFTAVDNDTFTFTFDGIGPQQMALNIKATLNVNGEAVAEFDKYSVEKNLNNIKYAEGATDALIALVNSVLIYGDESEKYVGFEDGVDASELANDVAANDATYTLANAEAFGFTAAGVNFDAANKIYVKFYVEGEFTLTVNGTAVAVEATEDGNYKVYTDALTATQFADTYTFVITVGEETATLTYSVNAYAAAMQNDAEMGALAAALYAYGVNAKAYAA